MPAAIAHYYHALQVWKQNGWKDSSKFKDAFLWGAQGPDFFYFDRILQPWKENLRGIGSRLHREKPSHLLNAMRNFQTSEGNQVTEAYLYGFLCHYSLDRTVHPFVYWDVSNLRKLYPGRGDGFLHNQTESILDGILLRSVNGQLANEFDLRQTVPRNPEVEKAIAQMYASVLVRLYGNYASQKELLRAMKECRKISGLLRDRWMMKKPLAEALERILHRYLFSSAIRGISEPDGFDYANVLHSEWVWPENCFTRRTESFFDLFQNSIQESIQFIHACKIANFSELTQNISFC